MGDHIDHGKMKAFITGGKFIQHIANYRKFLFANSVILLHQKIN